MPWFGAHAVLVVRFKDGIQDSLPAWENIYLIEARDSEEAKSKALGLGRGQEGDSEGTFHWEDRPARWQFVGVRKVVEISSAAMGPVRPNDGTEVTYSLLNFPDEESLRRYVEGASVALKVVE